MPKPPKKFPSASDVEAPQAEETETKPQKAFDKDLKEALGLTDDLVTEVVKKLTDGATVVECCWFLMKQTPGMTLQMATKALTEAIALTYGAFTQSDWNDIYKAQVNDLYGRALKEKKIQVANQILKTAATIQYMSQQNQLKTRDQDMDEAKFKASISLPLKGNNNVGLLEAAMNGKEIDSTTQTGFRLQIESITQSTPKENSQVVELQDITPSAGNLDPDNLDP